MKKIHGILLAAVASAMGYGMWRNAGGLQPVFKLGVTASEVASAEPPVPRIDDTIPDDNPEWVHERYDRVPILGPITSGGPAIALEPPSDDEVLRAFEKSMPKAAGLPMLYEVRRDNVRIVKEKIADYVDPPRHVPLIGPAQLHHAHYKCTVYYTEVVRVGWPVPHTLVDEDEREVIYIDHNHFHMVGNVDTGAGAEF